MTAAQLHQFLSSRSGPNSVAGDPKPAKRRIRERPEEVLQIQCVAWWDAQHGHRADCDLFHIPNGGSRGGKRKVNRKTGKTYTVEAAKLKSMGLRPGRPDLQLLTGLAKQRLPVVTFIEMKAPGKKSGQSASQRAFQKKCANMGIAYHVVDSLGEFQRIVNSTIEL